MAAIDFFQTLPSFAHFARDGILPPPRVKSPPFSAAMRPFLDQMRMTDFCRQSPSHANLLSGCLAAPRTLVHLLDYLGRNSRQTMNILYLGAGLYESFDAGRWFSLYHKLHPRAPKAQITLIGPELVDLTSGAHIPSPAAQACQLHHHAEPCVEAQYRMGLQDAWHQSPALRDQITSGYFDLIVMHHPGHFVSDHSWLKDEALGYLLSEHHDRIVGTAFSAHDLMLDMPVFMTRGRYFRGPQVNPEPHQSRYYPTFFENVRWGHVMWRLIDRRDDAWEPMRYVDADTVTMTIDSISMGLRHLADQGLISTDSQRGFPGEWLLDNKTMVIAPGWTLDSGTGQIHIDIPGLRTTVPMSAIPNLGPIDLIDPDFPPIARSSGALVLASLLAQQIAVD